MDNQSNQWTNAGSYQQGVPNQQGNPYMGNGYGNYGGNQGSFEQVKAPNIFQQFVLSFVPTQYDRLARVKTGSMIGFVTLLVLIATVISFVSVAFTFASIDVSGLVNQLPDFTITNGHLHLEEDFLYDEDIVFVYVTDEIDSFSYEDAAGMADDGYQNIMLVGRDRISIMQNREYQQLDFSDLGDSMEISREWIVSTLVPFLKVLLVVGYIIGFGVRVGWYFLCALIYMLFAMLIASVMKKRLDTGVLFRTAVYAKVLMFVVGTFLSLIPFVVVSVPLLLRVAVTIVFMGFAIAKLPENHPAPMAMGQGWR